MTSRPRVIYSTATTLDGFIATDDHSLDWLFAVEGAEAAEAGFSSFLAGVGVLVQGSSTYEWVLRHEQLVEHPEKWPGYYGDRPTFVFTSRYLAEVPGADVRFLTGSVERHWDAIRDAAGSLDVWIVGGGDLAGQFADAGLLDEVRVSIAPATLGRGRPLLPRALGTDRLALTGVTQTGPFAELTYAVTTPAA